MLVALILENQVQFKYFFFYRELREYRQRNEALNVDLKRKEKQIKDFQTRLDSEGCEYNFIVRSIQLVIF